MKIGNDLTKGPVLKKFILFVFPIILSNILQMLYTMADTAVVGKFAGGAALAAVGATGSFAGLILNLLFGLSVGANVVCAKAYGAGDEKAVSRIVHCAVLVAFISGVVICVIGELCSRFCLEWMNTPHDVIDGAVIYIRIYFLGAPMSFVYNFGAAILRAAGDTKRPLYILVITGIVNVGLNLLFVIVFKLGVAGVAWATIIAQTISAVATVVILMSAKNEFKLCLRKLRIYKNELMLMFKIGMPAGMNGMMYCIPNVLIQSVLNGFGSAVVAGSTAAANMESIISLGGSASEQACVSFVGQNIGARKLKRVDSVTKVAMLFAFITCVFMSFVVLMNKEFFMGLYTNESAVANAGYVRMSICLAYAFVAVPSQVFSGCFSGLGRSVEPAVITAVFVCGIRIVWIYTACAIFPSLVELVYCSYPLTWFAASVALAVMYLKIRKRIFGEIRDNGLEVMDES